MSVIRASVTDQRLKITEAPILASGGQNETSVVFTFCEKWDGFVKTAIFYRDENEVYYCVLDAENTCVVPWEVCSESGTFYIGVFGDKDGTRRTSTTVRYKVKRGAVTDDLYPSDPTPDVYSQIMDMVMDAQDNSVQVTEQDLTEEEKATVRDNIGAASVDEVPQDAVLYTAQELTNEQKSRARRNIGAPYLVDVENEIDRLDNMFVDVENEINQLDSKFDNVVLHTPYQSLTEEQKYNARQNIDAVGTLDYEDRTGRIEDRLVKTVLYTSQSLSDDQKAQARNNIGAANAADVENEIERLDEAISNIGGGGSAANQLVVTLIDFYGSSGTASHTPKQIYDHVQAGGAAVLIVEDRSHSLQAVDEYNAYFCFIDGETREIYTYAIYDDRFVDVFNANYVGHDHLEDYVYYHGNAKVGQALTVSSVYSSGEPKDWKLVDLPAQYVIDVAPDGDDGYEIARDFTFDWDEIVECAHDPHKNVVCKVRNGRDDPNFTMYHLQALYAEDGFATFSCVEYNTICQLDIYRSGSVQVSRTSVPVLATFKFADVYGVVFEVGMTWERFCNSNYNWLGLTYDQEGVYDQAGDPVADFGDPSGQGHNVYRYRIIDPLGCYSTL